MRSLLAASALTALLLLALALALVHGGGEPMPPGVILDVLRRGPAERPEDWTILVDYRLPRALAAALVGAALALSGLLMQGLFRNPLASPGILGATAGGAFGAVVSIALGLGGLWALWTPAFSFAGTLASVLIVHALAAGSHRSGMVYLVLCGVAVNTVFGAGTGLVLALSLDEVHLSRQIVHWLAGGFGHVVWKHVAILAPALGIAWAASLPLGRDLNLMLVGEESAHSLGVRLPALRRRVLLLTSLATGAAVAVAGMVGFVGLVVPHILRLLLGADHRRLLVTVPLLGAGFLVLADLLSRRAIEHQLLPLGIVTSLVGGAFFLFLLLAEREKMS